MPDEGRTSAEEGERSETPDRGETLDRGESPDRSEAPDHSEASAGADHRAGFCAILGPPNAGKSTFLNRALGVPIAAVSPKPQTTRNRIVGVVNVPGASTPRAPNEAESEADSEAVAAGEGVSDSQGRGGQSKDAEAPGEAATAGTPDEPAPGDAAGAEETQGPSAQIVFVDTPGAQSGEGALRHFMRDELLSAAADCDVGLVFIDVSQRAQRSPGALPHDRQRALDAALGAARVPLVLAVNKVDTLADKRELLPILDAYYQTGRFEAIVPLSAKTGDGLDRVQREVVARLPRGQNLFPEEMITDRAERFLVGELIREQLFLQLGDEIPYATAVAVEQFRERRDHGDVVIDAVIHVERESQKPIVVGRAGRRIKEVGTRSRDAIGKLLGCPAHVHLHVKVTPKWSRTAQTLREVGYER